MNCTCYPIPIFFYFPGLIKLKAFYSARYLTVPGCCSAGHILLAPAPAAHVALAALLRRALAPRTTNLQADFRIRMRMFWSDPNPDLD